MEFIRSNNQYINKAGATTLLKKMRSCGIPEVITACLGVRLPQSTYGFDDVLIAWILAMNTGYTRLEQIRHLKEDWKSLHDIDIPSHDTVNRVMRKLSTEVQYQERVYSNVTNVTQYNDNIAMNDLLVKTSVAVGALKHHKEYTLDIDATFIANHCQSAVRKKHKEGKGDHSAVGYYPLVCLIEDKPVFISMRDGYAGPKFELLSCLENALTLLKKSNVNVTRVTSDGASYNRKAMKMLYDNGYKFNFRFPARTSYLDFNKALKAHKKWRTTEIKTANMVWNCEIANISYRPSYDNKNEKLPILRVVTIRMPFKKKKQEMHRQEFVDEKLEKAEGRGKLKAKGPKHSDNSWKRIGDHMYKFYLTNDFEARAEDIVLEYNQRGTQERRLAFMKNDFSWKHLPFYTSMAHNTVYMITAAMANNCFKGILDLLQQHMPNFYDQMRLKMFLSKFINKPARYFNGVFDFGDTEIPFEKLV